MIGCPAPFVPLLTRIKIKSIANCHPDAIMLNPLFNITALEQNIAAGDLILTPNHRLARVIRSTWGEQCAARRGLTRWPQPQIYALESWLEECWQQLLDQCYIPALAGAVVSDQGATLLWRTAIGSDREAPPDLDPSNFVRLAQQTWRDLQRWSIQPHQLAASRHPGTQYFLRWLKGFQQALGERQLLTREDSYAIIADAFAERVLQRHPRVVTIGFQTTPPLFARIILAASDVEPLQPQPSPRHTSAVHGTVLSDENAEITAAAHWAMEQYKLDPHQRIGVVFSSLNRMRDKVERIFRDTFSPTHCLPGSPHAPASFNLSAGTPLGQTPVIRTALSLLTLHSTVPFTLDEYCALLNNPFWGATTADIVLRSQAELLLRKLGKVVPDHDDLRSALQQAQSSLREHSSNLAELLQKVRELARHRPRRAQYSYWAQHCTQCLTVFGWPGARALDSIEYQQVERWRTVLEEMAALDYYATPVTFGEALSELTQLANNAVFQPETPDSAIQILGLLEAASLRFDQLWVAGMDSNQWPQGVVYNPLLPPALQRQWQLPKACPEQELALAQVLFDQFSHSADQVLFSYSRMEGDTELRPSALLDGLQPYPLPAKPDANNDSGASTSWGLVPQMIGTQPILETVTTHSAPPLDSLPQQWRGGSGLLRDQAGCPFNAFAIWRLGATPLPDPQPGLSPQERGVLVHRCLELLWRQLQSQANLLALDKGALSARTTEVIDLALAPLERRRPDLFGVRFSRLERQRLQHLLHSWLEIDRARSPFVVNPPEQETSVTIGGLVLTLRMDRIDRLENDELVLIDYKTGAANIKDWGGERPADPQLPLYALRAEAPIAALCFARVSTAKDCALNGIAENPDLLPKLEPLGKLALPSTWAGTLEHWHHALTVLADEFCAGTTPIVFYNPSTLRNQSYLLPLNRYPEQQLLNDDPQENDATQIITEFLS